MKSEITVTAHSVTADQLNVFKAVGKAMKVKVKVNKLSKKEVKKQKFIDGFKRALNDVKLIKEGKLKTRPATEILNEL